MAEEIQPKFAIPTRDYGGFIKGMRYRIVLDSFYKGVGLYGTSSFKVPHPRGGTAFCLTKNCGHLGGGSWILKRK